MLHSQLGGRGFQQPRGGGAGYEQQQGEDGGLPNMMSHLMLHPDDEAQGGMSGFGRGMPFADGGGGRGLGGGSEFAPSGIGGGGGGGLGYNNMGLSNNNPGMRANQQSEGVRGVSRLFERAPAPQMGGGGSFENGGGMMEAKPAAVMGLVALGFHESSAREALFVCANNFERAYEFLLGQQGGGDMAQTNDDSNALGWESLPQDQGFSKQGPGQQDAFGFPQHGHGGDEQMMGQFRDSSAPGPSYDPLGARGGAQGAGFGGGGGGRMPNGNVNGNGNGGFGQAFGGFQQQMQQQQATKMMGAFGVSNGSGGNGLGLDDMGSIGFGGLPAEDFFAPQQTSFGGQAASGLGGSVGNNNGGSIMSSGGLGGLPSAGAGGMGGFGHASGSSQQGIGMGMGMGMGLFGDDKATDAGTTKGRGFFGSLGGAGNESDPMFSGLNDAMPFGGEQSSNRTGLYGDGAEAERQGMSDQMMEEQRRTARMQQQQQQQQQSSANGGAPGPYNASMGSSPYCFPNGGDASRGNSQFAQSQVGASNGGSGGGGGSTEWPTLGDVPKPGATAGAGAGAGGAGGNSQGEKWGGSGGGGGEVLDTLIWLIHENGGELDGTKLGMLYKIRGDARYVISDSNGLKGFCLRHPDVLEFVGDKVGRGKACLRPGVAIPPPPSHISGSSPLGGLASTGTASTGQSATSSASAPAQALANAEGKQTVSLTGRVTNGAGESWFMESSPGVSDVYVSAAVCNAISLPVRVNDMLTVDAIENRYGKNSYKAIRITQVNNSSVRYPGEQGGVGVRAPAAPGAGGDSVLSQVIALIREGGGELLGVNLGMLYERCADARSEMMAVGGLKGYCQKHSEYLLFDEEGGRTRARLRDGSKAGGVAPGQQQQQKLQQGYMQQQPQRQAATGPSASGSAASQSKQQVAGGIVGVDRDAGLPLKTINGRITNGHGTNWFMESSPGVSDVYIPPVVCEMVTATTPMRAGDVITVQAVEHRYGKNRWRAVKLVSTLPPQATRKITGKVTNIHADACFMESAPGASDVFIPPQIFDVLATPLKAGDVITVDAVESTHGKNKWKAVRMHLNGMTLKKPAGGAGNRDEPRYERVQEMRSQELQELMDLGFGEKAAKDALRLTGGDLNAAAEVLYENGEAGDETKGMNNLDVLVLRGFSSESAKEALFLFEDDLSKSHEWLLERARG